MKDFTDVNLWLKSASFSDLTSAISRAVSRVTTTRNDVFRIESEYVSGYNSVQTLGYDSDGHIQDQTSSDRLTIPSGVLAKYEAILRQHRNALTVDRDQFTAELNLHPGLLTSLVSSPTMGDNDRQYVLNLGGIVQLVIDRTSTTTAKATIPLSIAELLGTNPRNSTFPIMPQVAYIRNGAMDVMIWSDAFRYPKPMVLGGSEKSWRIIYFQGSLNRRHMIITISAAGSGILCFHFTQPLQTSTSLVFSDTKEIEDEIYSVDDLNFILSKAGLPSNSRLGMIFMNTTDFKPAFEDYDNLESGEKSAIDYIISDSWDLDATEATYSIAVPTAIYKGIFDLITTITPESLTDLITRISS